MQNPELTQVAEKENRSKTQELRDWLDREIRRAESDTRVLEPSLLNQEKLGVSCDAASIPRYSHLTSDEREAKMDEDRKKLEQLKRRLELLRSARELDVDIDGIEECFGTKVDVTYQKGFNEIHFPVLLSFVIDKEVRTRVHFFPLAQREIRVTQHVGSVYVDNYDCHGIVGCELTDGLPSASPFVKSRCLQIELPYGFLRIFDSGRVSFSPKRDKK